MDLIYALLIIVILICLIAIAYIYYYNRLQDAKLKIEEAESIIDENLRDKYDTISTIKSIIDKETKNKKIVFKDIEKLKNFNLSNFELDRKLDEYNELINSIDNDYKVLQNDKTFQEQKEKLKKANEKIESAKSFYNKYITEANSLALKFPSNIIAKFHNFEVKNFFDNKDMNDDNINDFKL